MDLNIFILVICLLGLILISYKIKDKNIIYFLCVMLIFLTLKRYFESREQFQSTQEKEAISSLEDAVNKTAETEELQERVGGLETNIEDLKKIMRSQNLSRQMERGDEAKTFSMTESQKRQDSNLESLETEIDILLKMYKEENMNNDKDIRSSDNRTTQDLLRDLEKADTLKNLGLNSESAEELNSLLQAEDSQNIDVNFNIL